MTTVEPEEVEALTGEPGEAQAASAEVVERDFGKPLRLGAGRMGAMRRKLESGLFQLSSGVSDILGRTTEVRLLGLREVHADVVREGLEEPLVASRFTVNGQIGWTVWDNSAAVRAVEFLLCGGSPEEVERGLSELETDLVEGVLDQIVQATSEAAGVEAQDHRAVTLLGRFGTWYEPGDSADAHRVAFDLSIVSGEEESELCVYLPGMATSSAADDAPADLPNHLDSVQVALSARLGEVDIPLADLLALEDGDVIPLGTPVDGTLSVTVDGRELARGVLGTTRGKLAVRLTEIQEPGSVEELTEEKAE